MCIRDSTSLRDYFKWDQALSNRDDMAKRLSMSPESLASVFKAGQLNDGTATEYGFGWRLRTIDQRKEIFHDGRTSGFNNAVIRIPDIKLSVCVLTNRADASAGAIAKKVVEAYLSKELQPSP